MKALNYLSNLLNLILIWNQRRHYHVSIETLPLSKWWKIQETNDYSYLNKGIKDHTLKSSKIYENMFNEYIKLGGLGEDYIKLLELKRKWILKRSEWLTNGNRGSQMDSSMLDIDIQEKEKGLQGKNGTTKEDALMIISENLSSHITAENITVAEFQGYLNYYGKRR